MQKEISNNSMGCFTSGIIILGTGFLFSLIYEFTSNAFVALVVTIVIGGITFKYIDENSNFTKKHMVSIELVDELSGDDFERFLVTLFLDTGNKAWKTRTSGDFGIDVLVQQENRLIAIQAKRSKSNIGVKALYEAVGGAAYYKADEAWVITNSKFTNQAWTYAEKTNRVKLVDRAGLSRLIKDRNRAIQKKINEEEKGKLRN